LGEIKDRVDRRERVLVTTLTSAAEDLTGICKIRIPGALFALGEINSIHSEILQDLRELEI